MWASHAPHFSLEKKNLLHQRAAHCSATTSSSLFLFSPPPLSEAESWGPGPSKDFPQATLTVPGHRQVSIISWAAGNTDGAGRCWLPACCVLREAGRWLQGIPLSWGLGAGVPAQPWPCPGCWGFHVHEAPVGTTGCRTLQRGPPAERKRNGPDPHLEQQPGPWRPVPASTLCC